MTFEEVWDKSSKINGWFSEANARRLFEVAMSCESGSEFVEIGPYYGRSSSVLGQIAMDRGDHLTCVDTFGLNYSAAFILPNLKDAGVHRCTVMMMLSEIAAERFMRSIDLVLVDGNHRREWVEKDCNLWLPKLKVGGWALFHDYGPGWPGVMQAVDELEGYEGHGVIESLAIRRKVKE